MAIDGDPSTSWLVADRAPAIDEFIVARGRANRSTTSRCASPTRPTESAGSPTSRSDRRRWRPGRSSTSTNVAGRRRPADRHRPDHGGEHRSRCGSPVPSTGGSTSRRSVRRSAASGFATIDVGLEPTTELIRVPIDGTTAIDGCDATTPLSYVFTRLRIDPTDRWRSDPEPALRRQFDGAERCRRSTRASRSAPTSAWTTTALAELLGEPVAATDHLTGVPAARGAAAFDGDSATSWITSFGSPVGQSLSTSPLDGTADIRSRSPSRTGTFSPDHRRSGSATRPDRSTSTSTDRRRRATLTFPRTIDLRRRDDRDHRSRRAHHRSTGGSARRSCCRRRSPRSPSTARHPPAVAPGRRDHVEECRDDLLRSTAQPVGLSFTASTEADPARRRRSTPPCVPATVVRAGARRRHARRCSTRPGHGVRVRRRSGRARRAGRRPMRPDRDARSDRRPSPDCRGLVGPSRCRRARGMLGRAR